MAKINQHLGRKKTVLLTLVTDFATKKVALTSTTVPANRYKIIKSAPNAENCFEINVVKASTVKLKFCILTLAESDQ